MEKKHIFIETGNAIIRVDLSQIIYIEKVGRKALVVTENGVITWYRTMDQLKTVTDERFMKCHRSYLINMDKIVKMESQNIWLEGGFHIIFGRESFRKAMHIFREYICSEKTSKNID